MPALPALFSLSAPASSPAPTLASTLASVLELDALVLDLDTPGLALEASRDGGEEEEERNGL